MTVTNATLELKQKRLLCAMLTNNNHNTSFAIAFNFAQFKCNLNLSQYECRLFYVRANHHAIHQCIKINAMELFCFNFW